MDYEPWITCESILMCKKGQQNSNSCRRSLELVTYHWANTTVIIVTVIISYNNILYIFLKNKLEDFECFHHKEMVNV